jgi:DNA repair photolyase
MAFAGGEQTSTERVLAESNVSASAVSAGTQSGWTVDPYTGCEFGCVFCPVRLDEQDFPAWRRFEARVGVNLRAVKSFIERVSPEELHGCRVVLGSRSEPWQPAEERFRLTRSLLAALAEGRDLELRANTRSSLVARDIDLLLRIASRGQVSVVFSISCVDERITRLMEPKGPSVLRRLAAMGALARAGLTVGLSISPVMAGLDPEELGLGTLLTRAAHAGARFASMRWMELGPGQRERFLAYATAAFPGSASRFRRVIGRRALEGESRADWESQFRQHCQTLGLLYDSQSGVTESRSAPAQLPLFSMPSAH